MQKSLCNNLRDTNLSNTADKQDNNKTRYCYLVVSLFFIVITQLPRPALAQTITINDNIPINILEDRDALTGLLGSALACRLAEELMIDLERSPVYTSVGTDCLVTESFSSDQNALFSDANCQQPVLVNEIPQLQYCTDATDNVRFGDGSGLPVQPAHDQWLLSPGNLFDIGAASLSGLQQPYLQRVNYKQVETERGTCNLEMRIYRNDLSATDSRSMLALHGGSWRARGFGFLGLEMTVPRLTDQGFVVFAPFYRLIDTDEGIPACHDATLAQVREDAADALRWVEQNASLYGASSFPAVFGQSAGAHLATSLAVDFPERVANAVLFYPPTDFTDFGLRVIDGRYTNDQGLDILQAVVGTTVEEFDVSASPVPENSFPQQVVTNPESFPPMFMLHGLADELVEATHSTRLCGALSGDLESVAEREFWIEQGDEEIVIDCDSRGSELHMIRQGDHALDICLSDNILLQQLCLSGPEQSRRLVADTVNEATQWAASVADVRAAQLDAGEIGGGNNSVDSENRSGGSGAGFGLLLGVMWFVRRRLNHPTMHQAHQAQ